MWLDPIINMLLLVQLGANLKKNFEKKEFVCKALFLVKTITHKFWAWKNDFARFYVKLTIVWGWER